jgi:hypothetical protein
MTKIDLLEFFRTGQLGPVEIGMTRAEVEQFLGEPDSYQPTVSNSADNLATAQIWEYGGIELCFATLADVSPASHKLINITFNPIYLAAPEKWQTDIKPWVFGSYFGPTRQELKEALMLAAIPYKDDKQPKLTRHTNGRHHKTSWLYSVNDEISGTLHLPSGVLVSYSKDDLILNVQLEQA